MVHAKPDPVGRTLRHRGVQCVGRLNGRRRVHWMPAQPAQLPLVAARRATRRAAPGHAAAWRATHLAAAADAAASHAAAPEAAAGHAAASLAAAS